LRPYLTADWNAAFDLVHRHFQDGGWSVANITADYVQVHSDTPFARYHMRKEVWHWFRLSLGDRPVMALWRGTDAAYYAA